MADEYRENDGRFRPGNPWRFRPGEPRRGRPRLQYGSLTAYLRYVLDKDRGRYGRAMVMRAVQRAMAGDFRFWKEIFDRLEGQPTQHIEAAVRDARELRAFATEVAALVARYLPPEAMESFQRDLDALTQRNLSQRLLLEPDEQLH